MELILISNSKLKIMLDESDMKKYHICNESDCADGMARKAIRSLLDEAKDQIGFNTDGEEIFVQLYASKKGGCELFVTKCHPHKLEEHQPDFSHQEAEAPTNLPVKRRASLPAVKEKRGTYIAYSFGELSYIIKVCKILAAKGKFPGSQAYNDRNGRFYLLLDSVGASAYSRLDSLTFITEYGSREREDKILPYISEHGKVICEKNAVDILSKF